MVARLTRISVRGLRCLDGLDLDFASLTALIGANGSGKSSTVQALTFLFGLTDLDDDDVSDGSVDAEIAVTGTFAELPEPWAAMLASWTVDGTVSVTRVRTAGTGGRPVYVWRSSRRQAPGFQEVRNAIAQGAPAADIKQRYAEARDIVGAEGLPAYTNKAQVLPSLDAFEAAHPEQLVNPSDDGSLGFGSSATIDLTSMIELLVIPALRDAADDATESRGSALARLVDIAVRNQMDLTADLAALTERTGAEFTGIIDTHGRARLDDLSEQLTTQMNTFAPGSQVRLSWQPKMPTLTPPPVRARIVESGHEADIGRQGHGVQRAYVFSLLRALLDTRRSADDQQPGLLLVIEEPEVYQHPVRARYVARVLSDLATATTESTQVVITTHSPYFVSINNVGAIRLLRLTPLQANGTTVQRTTATSASLTDIASRLKAAQGGQGQTWTADRVAARLPGLLGTTVSEGFFAAGVVLVEGDEDVGALDGAARVTSNDLAAAGVAVIPVDGKNNLLLAGEVMRSLGIPVYTVFDTDEKPPGKTSDAGALADNRMLIDLAGGDGVERPETTVADTYAAIKPTLRTQLDSEVGAKPVAAAYAAVSARLGLPASAVKNGYLVEEVIVELASQGHQSATLGAIIEAALRLPDGPVDPGSSVDVDSPNTPAPTVDAGPAAELDTGTSATLPVVIAEPMQPIAPTDS